MFNLVVSNVPGPQQTFYLAGVPLLEVFPAVPLNPRNQALSIGIVSYDGGVRFGLLADRDALPDLDDGRGGAAEGCGGAAGGGRGGTARRLGLGRLRELARLGLPGRLGLGSLGRLHGRHMDLRQLTLGTFAAGGGVLTFGIFGAFGALIFLGALTGFAAAGVSAPLALGLRRPGPGSCLSRRGRRRGGRAGCLPRCASRGPWATGSGVAPVDRPVAVHGGSAKEPAASAADRARCLLHVVSVAAFAPTPGTFL